MKLLFLIGDTAVGKMTVGQALMTITKMRLFHNHMMIEPVLEVFGYRHANAVSRLREVIFEEFAQSDAYGMIFTFMWAFDQPSDWAYVEHVGDIFKRGNAEIYYVELVASQEIRLQRNVTENRLQHKASKRNVEASSQRLLSDDAKYRCISFDGEVPFENYLKIDNSELSPEEAAQRIKERFSL